MKLTIERSKWLRGTEAWNENENNSVLLNAEGKMCCLGFYCLARGYQHKEIFNMGSPAAVAEKTGKNLLHPEMSYHPSSIVRILMDVNDNKHMTQIVRESIIKEYFSKIGVEVEFTR